MIFSFIVVVWLMSTATAITVEEVTTPNVRFDRGIGTMITHPRDPRLLVVIDESSVWTFDPVTKKKSFIAGSSTRGYNEGKGSDARFNFPSASTHFNDTTIIITDYSNYCVRLVNIVTQLTERYAGVCKSRGFNDGDRLIAKFRYPWGSTRVGDTFYVCDQVNKKVRQISGNTVSTLASDLKDPRGLTSIDNKLIYTTQKNLNEFDLKTRTNTLIDGDLYPGLKNMLFSNLDDVVAFTDKIFIVADRNKQTVVIIDTDKQIITATNKLSSSPRSLLLYNSSVLVGLDTGKIMRFSLTELSDPLTLKCPENMKLMLPVHSKMLTVAVPQPVLNGTRLECWSCPPLTQILSEGVHSIEFKYRDKLTKQTVNCSYQVEIITPDPVCTNETRYIFLKPNQTKTEGIKIGDTGVSIEFEEGEHKVRVRDDCYITYIVNEMSSMIRKVQLVAEYPIKCQSLSKLSLNIINSHLFQHTQNIRKYCPVCQVDSSPSPLTQCTNDTLIASWNTDITEDQQASTDDIRKKLHSALVEFQNKYLVMDITIFTAVPRTVSPVKDQAGLYLRVKTTAICADKNFLYNKKLDVCVRTNH